MLSLKKSEQSRQFAVILNAKTKSVEEILYIVERDSYHMKEDPELRIKLSKYADLTFSSTNDEDLTHSLTLKPEYILFPVPASFQTEGSNQRAAVSVSGKAGSGKSFFVAQYVDAYHTMYPKNMIYYVSLNRIARDPSYAKLLKKTSFKKVLIEVNPSKISAALDSGSFENTLFIFDDIVDVEIPVCPEAIRVDYRKEKENTYYAKEQARLRTKEERRREQCENKGMVFKPLNPEELRKRIHPMDQQALEATLMDQAILTRLNKTRSQFIKECIHNTIQNFLKNGRKYGISVITTTHRFFDRNPTVDCANDESGLVVLFPYANVSNEKLVEFLRDKLCFDLTQARSVSSRVFKNYEFLAINTSGRKFFFTSHYLQFL